MSGSHDAVRRVVAAFEQSDWAEIDVRVGDIRVHLAAGSSPGPADATPTEPVPTTVPTPEPDDPHDGAPASSPAAPDGAEVVASPTPGIFWRSPQPGAPPFADTGDRVDATTTVCIIEVMKLMNHLKAGVAGEVVAVYGRNGVAVQKGEPLFAIKPTGT